MKSPLMRIWSLATRRWKLLTLLAVVATGLAVGVLRHPEFRQFATTTIGRLALIAHSREAKAECDHEDHDYGSPSASKPVPCSDEHDHASEVKDSHGDADHDTDTHTSDEHVASKPEQSAKVKLSATAQANVGLRLAKVELRPFDRTIAVPAMIVERAGQSVVHIAAPLTGVVSQIWPMQGETVTPGQRLFDLRLTHQDVIEAQSELLRTAEELDVLRRELIRLEAVAASGAVAGKALLERKYDQQKFEATLRSQRQRLMLHGLSQTQVDGILTNRTLLSELTVTAPGQPTRASNLMAGPLLQVQELKIAKGQHVNAGDPLCILADHSDLFIQGKAFEQDAAILDNAANNDWKVSAVVNSNGRERLHVSDLKILYLGNKVESDSRAFLFYVQLPNKPIRDHRTADGHRFSTWQFRPGQRVELLVPVERWADRIVLPIGAVTQDGAEHYVFEQHDGEFCRRPVKIEYRDQYSAVIANDGALTLGSSVIVSGAYQVHLAMKNKAGGAPDPHAGHNH